MTFRALLRVTILQLLRATGFDKAPPQAIDILTDVYIRHLQLLTTEALQLAALRNGGDATLDVQDITQALVNVGMLKPSNVLDVYEQYDDYGSEHHTTGGNKGAKEFLLWVVGNIPERARTASRPATAEVENGAEKKVSSVIPEYMNALEGLSADNTREGTRAGGGGQSSSSAAAAQDYQQQQEQEQEDWLLYVMKKSSKLGMTEAKFKNTVLRDGNTRSDFKVVGPEVVDQLEDKLPYNRVTLDSIELE